MKFSTCFGATSGKSSITKFPEFVSIRTKVSYSAKAKGSDVVVVDTAGRLHTRSNLMAELDKMYRVIENRFPEFNGCSLITLDASLGQNSLNQVKEFHSHGALDGVILTKLDGTARGGIVFPLFKQLGIPVKFLGVGEDLNDLELFDPESYVDGLLGVGEDLEQT